MSGQDMAIESANVRSNPNIRCAGAGTARRDKIDLRAGTLLPKQLKTFGMIVENQNASDDFATNINFRRYYNGEDSLSS